MMRFAEASGPEPPARPKRRWQRWLLRTVAAVTFIALALVVFWMKGAIYNRLVRFPQEEAAWRSLRAQSRAVTNHTGWTEYRGILHTHSLLSHDCEVPFEEILRVMKDGAIDFICLSDHCDAGRADFNAQWRGLRDGRLFIPGFEMRNGFMPFGVASGVVLSNSTDPSVLATQIVKNGGLLFYAHSEEEREWERPELAGMEIFNIHSCFKQSSGFSGLLPDLLVNHRKYPEHVVWSIAQSPVDLVRRWDGLNQTRHITGIAANDCHQNTGVRILSTEEGKLRIEDTSPQTLKEISLNLLTRSLARLLFGPLEPGRVLFHFQLDPYPRMAKLVRTHVLARELSEPAVLDSLKAGRAFVGFDMIADSTGFQFFAERESLLAIMGESAVYEPGLRLRASSPIPCRFTLVHDGSVMNSQEGYDALWTPAAAGKYRVLAEVKVRDRWVPWVYANPIELRSTP